MIIKEISRGIPYIEDLPLKDMLYVVQNLHEHEITEKVDGSQILFGIDDTGFYTSRETKGGIRIYNEKDYGISFSTTYLRSAHKFLEGILPFMKQVGFKNGDQVEAEVLYGELPNVIPYSGDTNRLIFLRTTEGSINVTQLKKLDGTSIHVTLSRPITDDGRNIYLKETVDKWECAKVPFIQYNSEDLNRGLASRIKPLLDYLDEKSNVYGISKGIILETPLNKRPEWCHPKDWKETKKIVKEERERLEFAILVNFTRKIQHILNDYLVFSQSSGFGPVLEEGGWIEGAVIRNTKTGKMCKVVDKWHFSQVRENAWETRNSLTEKAQALDKKISLLSELYIGMATAIGHPLLGTTRAKDYLRRSGMLTEGKLIEEDIDIESFKKYWISLSEKKTVDLVERLDKYEKEITEYRASKSKLDAKNGPYRVFFYLPGVEKRTKEVFATLFEQIEVLKQDITRIETYSDMIELLIGRRLDSLT